MNVVLVRQYRKAVEQVLLEVPAGGLDNGEEPPACTRRELQEEMGYLASVFTSPGFVPKSCTLSWLWV